MKVCTLWHQVEGGYNKEEISILLKMHKLGGGVGC